MSVGADRLSQAERARRVSKVLWLTLCLNWTVSVLKLVLGLMTNCMVIVADGLHSFSDGASNLVGLAGIHVAGRPADRTHPYGHQKFETLAATGIGLLLLGVAFGVLKQGVEGLLRPHRPEVNAVSFAVMGFTLLVNLAVVWYERRKARELGSELLKADSWHTLTDVFVTLTVFAALIGIAMDVPFLDPVFSLVIGGVIVVTALSILKHSADVLSDHVVVDPARIDEIVRRHPDVRDCHEIRSRGRHDQIYVDLHVLVDADMNVLEAHKVANRIERDIRAGIAGVVDVVVHIEPDTHDHDELGMAEGAR
ncbi:MAG: putative cation efflux system protein [Candidatus Omnitrophica bacterium]|nr:putative cation efflux system protein [Candidatus Omnitrophota bacterium]